MKIAVASDHAGIHLKRVILEYLAQKGIEHKDFGCFTEERVDYPIFAEKAAKAVVSGEFERGILFCGSGIGVSITANKIHGIRAVVCSEPYSAVLSRQHNNSNILALGERVVGPGLAVLIVEQWLAAEYEGGRHQQRLDIISRIEDEQKR